MIQDIVDGICTALDQEFNGSSREYEIYTEAVEQGLKEPCFFAFCISQNHDLQTAMRYQRSYSYMIQYFPVTEDRRAECQAVMERLASCLEKITMEKTKIRTSRITGQVVDGILNVSADYTVFVCAPVKQSEMEALGAEINVKE